MIGPAALSKTDPLTGGAPGAAARAHRAPPPTPTPRATQRT